MIKNVFRLGSIICRIKVARDFLIPAMRPELPRSRKEFSAALNSMTLSGNQASVVSNK